jgi:hypothetical protein
MPTEAEIRQLVNDELDQVAGGRTAGLPPNRPDPVLPDSAWNRHRYPGLLSPIPMMQLETAWYRHK